MCRGISLWFTPAPIPHPAIHPPVHERSAFNVPARCLLARRARRLLSRDCARLCDAVDFCVGPRTECVIVRGCRAVRWSPGSRPPLVGSAPVRLRPAAGVQGYFTSSYKGVVPTDHRAGRQGPGTRQGVAADIGGDTTHVLTEGWPEPIFPYIDNT